MPQRPVHQCEAPWAGQQPGQGAGVCLAGAEYHPIVDPSQGLSLGPSQEWGARLGLPPRTTCPAELGTLLLRVTLGLYGQRNPLQDPLPVTFHHSAVGGHTDSWVAGRGWVGALGLATWCLDT